MTEDQQLRKQLIKHIKGGDAFAPIDSMLKEISFEDVGKVPDGLPYSFYQQLYHIYIAQKDIFDFSMGSDYKELDWPGDYWPGKTAPDTDEEWQEVIEKYIRNREALCAYIADASNDLFTPLAHGTGQTLLREALLVIEHTAYHTGQMLVILRLLGLHT